VDKTKRVYTRVYNETEGVLVPIRFQDFDQALKFCTEIGHWTQPRVTLTELTNCTQVDVVFPDVKSFRETFKIGLEGLVW
jgi:hypothetical protein